MKASSSEDEDLGGAAALLDLQGQEQQLGALVPHAVAALGIPVVGTSPALDEGANARAESIAESSSRESSAKDDSSISCEDEQRTA
jgi:hypothetical protein